MKWQDKRFYSLNFYLRELFNEKVFKLSVDGGFTCPNRDGKIATNGCIFCSKEGSGEFAASRNLNIQDQIQQQIDLLKEKWPKGKCIVYFQNFTNTYDSKDILLEKYSSAIKFENIVGLAIATRADCINEDVISVLKEISKKTFIWIEIGLQSIHEKSANFVRRGYSLDVFEKALTLLNNANIPVVVHTILGLPTESKKDILSTMDYLSQKNIKGIKMHLLHILKNTDLYDYYKNNPFDLPNKDEYVNLIVESLEHLSPDIVIHRMTGDGNKSDLIAPLWSLNKRDILNKIDKKLKEKDTYQGKYFLSKIKKQG